MSLSSGQRLGVYEVISRLGSGGMGEVYRAHDTRLNRDVAIKVLPEMYAGDTERRARIEREAQMLAALNHANIAQIHGVEQAGEAPALVMEYVGGETLADRIARAAIPWDETLAIARQLAAALVAAHASGIVHRDLKPANIKITPAGQVKVLDFGLAKAFEPASLSGVSLANSPTITSPATQLGIVLGTAAYMSPEQARGKVVDKQADIWAFGCVLFEMLTGARPFEGETVTDTLARVLEREPDWSRLPAGTPVVIRTLLDRCLRKDPRRRLHDIADVLVEIEDAEARPEAVPLGVGMPSHVLPWWRTTSAIVSLVVATGLTAAVLARRAPPSAPALTTSVLPPAGVAFNFSEDFRFGPMMLSSDGAKLVFSALRPDGRIGLFLRAMGATESRELSGTEGGVYPFWSPDSRFVAFFADQKLRKIALVDGVITDIAGGIDPRGGRGGTWNKDDVILFAPGYFTPIKRVSAAGGPVSEVTALDPDRGQTTNRFPWFLPDGRHFLYTSQDTTAFFNRSTIRLGSLDSKTSEVLGEAESNAVYAGGFLLYIRENTSTLVAQPFDVETLKRTGEPLTVVEGVRTITVTSCGVFSVSDNGLLLYQPGIASSFAQLTWVDRDGNRTVAPGQPSNINLGDLHFSRDRRYLTASIQSPAGRGSEIWIYDADRGVMSPFTSDGRLKRSAVWSPDGTTIVFDASRTREGGPQDLYRKSADGSHDAELLFESEANKRPVGFSPDGKFLAYVVGTGLSGYDLYALPDPLTEKPGTPVPLARTPANEQWGQFSPTSPVIIYASSESGRYEIWQQPFPGPAGRQQITGTGGHLPRWRPDGKQMFYIAPDQRLMVADVVTDGLRIRVQTPRPVGAVALRSTGSFTYDVDMDGQRVLAVLSANQHANEPLTLVQNWMSRLASQRSR